MSRLTQQPPQHYNARINSIKEYTGRIDNFKYCFEISIEKYNNVFYKKEHQGYDTDFFCSYIDIFFGSMENFVNIYIKNSSEELSYYAEKINIGYFYDALNIHTDTNELTRTKRISFILEPLYFGFTDPELDRAGDIETLLKKRKLKKNIQGF